MLQIYHIFQIKASFLLFFYAMESRFISDLLLSVQLQILSHIKKNHENDDNYKIFLYLCNHIHERVQLIMTKEEALRRFKAAKQTKKDAVTALEEKMKQAYEEKTGLKANYVVTL